MKDIGIILRAKQLEHDFESINLQIKWLENQLEPAGKNSLNYYKTRLKNFLELSSLRDKVIKILIELEETDGLRDIADNNVSGFKFCNN